MSGRRPRVVLLALIVAVASSGLATLATPAASQTGSADLSLTKDGPATVTVGSDVTYELEVSNAGPETAQGVTVSDELPAGMVIASATTTKGSCVEAQTVVCEIGPLPSGQSETITIVATPTTSGSKTNQASVSSAMVDPVVSNNTGTVTTAAAGSSCTVVGTQGDDELSTGPGNDVLCGLGGKDTLDAGNGSNTIYGGSGKDTLAAGSGDDLLDGGLGKDEVSYADAGSAVEVDLAAGTATGWGTDTLTRVKDVLGSSKKDVIRGDGGANMLSGRGGIDLIYGRKGPDDLRGGGGHDYLHGGGGADDLDGGPGTDACVSGKRTSCLSTNPADGDDAKGPLDVKKVNTAFGSQSPAWKIKTRSSWTAAGIWDIGFFIVFLDTRGGPAADFYAMGRSNGSSMKGHVLKMKAGRDTKKGAVTATRPNATTMRLKVPLGKVNPGPNRTYFRWWVRTLYVATCKKVCFDSVPGGSRGLTQPLP